MGMSALVEIVVQRKENVLLVPSRAVKSNQQGRYVEVVTTQGTEQRAVKVGSSDGQRTEILEGLTEGEMVAMAQAAVQSNIRAGAFGAGLGGAPGGAFGGAPPPPSGGGR